MTLTLTLINIDRLDNGAPLHFIADRRGALIGRSARCDWRLPDPEQYISSRHCEIAFAVDQYTLTDLSTNGTMLNGAVERMTSPRQIERGDRFRIGRYDIVATLSEIAADADTVLDHDETVEVSPTATNGAAIAQLSGNAIPPAIVDATHEASFGAVPNPKLAPISKVATPLPPATAGDPITPAAPSLAPSNHSALIEEFVAAAGLEFDQIKGNEAEILKRAGLLLNHLVAGLVALVDARARAKSQMGAETTALNFDGNNPIKFARQPEQALAQLLNPKERGFMEAGAAVDDAFKDLQSHQFATLKAMQGALRATLVRFSPGAIRGRASAKGLLTRIVPGAREAALWQAYEREFAGIATGSDEAFMDVFAKEFRQAYIDHAGKPG